MAVRPEVVAQLSRMLGDAGLRSATDRELEAAAEAGFARLVGALLQETAASDDVTDTTSALAYMDSRLETLSQVLPRALIERLRSEVVAAIGDW